MTIAILNHCQLPGRWHLRYKRDLEITEFDISRFDCTCLHGIMDWAVDMTGLIITSGTSGGQEAQSMKVSSGGRSGTRSCWLMVDQICADPVWPPTPECVVLQTLLQLTCMWNVNQFCPSRVFPVQRVWCRTESLWSLDSLCIACTARPDAKSHDGVACRRPAWEFVCYPYEWHVHTIGAVHSAEVPQFHWCCIFWVQWC